MHGASCIIRCARSLARWNVWVRVAGGRGGWQKSSRPATAPPAARLRRQRGFILLVLIIRWTAAGDWGCLKSTYAFNIGAVASGSSSPAIEKPNDRHRPRRSRRITIGRRQNRLLAASIAKWEHIAAIPERLDNGAIDQVFRAVLGLLRCQACRIEAPAKACIRAGKKMRD